MVTNDLGACEWFVWDLRRSGLIDRGQLDAIVGEFLKRNPRAEAPALAELLVQQGTLTPFQADRILNGKTQGLVLGPYVLLDAIGQGSMGMVYRATSKNDSHTYAIKVLPRRSMWNVRLARRQVRSFGSFSHPAVVPFVDVGTAGGMHYLVWPMVEGQTLEAMVQHQGRLNPNQAALVGSQIAQGLNICHQNNIFHGLLKPSNVMIGQDGQARVLDFGIGSLLVENEGESLVDTMSTANTLTSGLDCASPECIMEPSNRTPAGDQYSLGCVLYYCLTGRVPFPEGSAVEKMMAHQAKEPVPLKEFAPEVPDGLAAVVKKLMAKKPEDRYPDTDQVVESLEPFLGELAAAAALPAATRTVSRPGSGSNLRMRGLEGRGASVASPSTPARPAPGLQPVTPPPSPGRSVAPAVHGNPGRGNVLPSRASFNHQQQQQQANNAAEEIQLLTLQELPPGYNDPAALRASAGWVTEGAADADRRAGRPAGGLGTVGVVCIALILMLVAFIGAKLLMQ